MYCWKISGNSVFTLMEWIQAVTILATPYWSLQCGVIIANNKCISNFNPNEKSSFRLFMDLTILNCHILSQPSKVSDGYLMKRYIILIFKRFPKKGIMVSYSRSIYPKELRELHSELPFLVEYVIVTFLLCSSWVND